MLINRWEITLSNEKNIYYFCIRVNMIVWSILTQINIFFSEKHRLGLLINLVKYDITHYDLYYECSNANRHLKGYANCIQNLNKAAKNYLLCKDTVA